MEKKSSWFCQYRFLNETSQQAHNVKMTSYQRRCDVILPSRHTTWKWRRINVDATWSRHIDVDTTSFSRIPDTTSLSTSMRRYHVASTLIRRHFHVHAASTLIRRHFHVLCLLGWYKYKTWSDNSQGKTPNSTFHSDVIMPVCLYQAIFRARSIILKPV